MRVRFNEQTGTWEIESGDGAWAPLASQFPDLASALEAAGTDLDAADEILAQWNQGTGPFASEEGDGAVGSEPSVGAQTSQSASGFDIPERPPGWVVPWPPMTTETEEVPNPNFDPEFGAGSNNPRTIEVTKQAPDWEKIQKVVEESRGTFSLTEGGRQRAIEAAANSGVAGATVVPDFESGVYRISHPSAIQQDPLASVPVFTDAGAAQMAARQAQQATGISFNVATRTSQGRTYFTFERQEPNIPGSLDEGMAQAFAEGNMDKALSFMNARQMMDRMEMATGGLITEDDLLNAAVRSAEQPADVADVFAVLRGSIPLEAQARGGQVFGTQQGGGQVFGQDQSVAEFDRRTRARAEGVLGDTPPTPPSSIFAPNPPAAPGELPAGFRPEIEAGTGFESRPQQEEAEGDDALSGLLPFVPFEGEAAERNPGGGVFDLSGLSDEELEAITPPQRRRPRQDGQGEAEAARERLRGRRRQREFERRGQRVTVFGR